VDASASRHLEFCESARAKGSHHVHDNIQLKIFYQTHHNIINLSTYQPPRPKPTETHRTKRGAKGIIIEDIRQRETTMLSVSRIINTTSILALTRGSVAFTSFTSPSTHARSTTRLFSTPPTRYLLSYEYIPDVLEKRGPYREGHLGLAKQMITEGSCVSGGPSLIPGESVPSGGECCVL
jgi:hypothetical protein